MNAIPTISSPRFGKLTPEIEARLFLNTVPPSKLDLSRLDPNADIERLKPNETLQALGDVSVKLASLVPVSHGQVTTETLPHWLLDPKQPPRGSQASALLDIKAYVQSVQASLKARQELLESHLLAMLKAPAALLDIQAICRQLRESDYTPDPKTPLGKQIEAAILEALSQASA